MPQGKRLYGKMYLSLLLSLVFRQIVQKLSTRQPSLECKLKVLKEIASERGIALHLEVDSPVVVEVGNLQSKEKQQSLTN